VTDLTKAIRQLAPLAKAIVEVSAHAEELEKIEARTKELDVKFEGRQDEWAAAEVAARKARASVEQANAEIIAAQAKG
jgi:chromosome segregation ATPase